MRHWLALTALLAGCTIQVVPGPTPKVSTTPVVKASASPGGQPSATPTAAPATSVPFTGVWMTTTDASAQGPVDQDVCAPFRRYDFTGAAIKVTDANAGFRGFYFNYETLAVKAGADARHWRFEGQDTGPGPTDGPMDTPVAYDLTYDDARQVLTGTRQVGTAAAQPITLVKTTVTGTCASPTPGATPTAEATATP